MLGGGAGEGGSRSESWGLDLTGGRRRGGRDTWRLVLLDMKYFGLVFNSYGWKEKRK